MPFPHYANAQLLNPPSQREFQQVLPPKWELLPFAVLFFNYPALRKVSQCMVCGSPVMLGTGRAPWRVMPGTFCRCQGLLGEMLRPEDLVKLAGT